MRIDALSLDTETTISFCEEMKRGPRPADEKELVLHLLRQGQFSTMVDASSIAGVTPQRVQQWAVAAGVDWKACRRRYLQQLWDREIRRQRLLGAGKTPRRRTKADLRKAGEKAVTDFIRKENARD